MIRLRDFKDHFVFLGWFSLLYLLQHVRTRSCHTVTTDGFYFIYSFFLNLYIYLKVSQGPFLSS